MLTVVHQLASNGVSERAGSAPQPGPTFQERDPQAAADKSRRGSQARQAAADNHHMRREGLVYQ